MVLMVGEFLSLRGMEGFVTRPMGGPCVITHGG